MCHGAAQSTRTIWEFLLKRKEGKIYETPREAERKAGGRNISVEGNKEKSKWR